MKEIKLSQGFVAKVDDEDFEYLNQFVWYVAIRGELIYATRMFGPKKKRIGYLMHRLIMNTPPNLTVDHIDHDGLNNQKYNLRNCTNQQNLMNMKHRPESRSKYIGVSFDRRQPNNPIIAHINHNGKHIYLGSFNTEEEAAIIRDKVAFKYRGEFAYLNFPDKKEEYNRWCLNLSADQNSLKVTLRKK